MMINRIAKIAAITGLTTLTVVSSLGLGSINVLADDAQLPNYVMDGTNAERAIADYFVNHADRNHDNSVVIPHMNIIKTQDNGSSMNVFGTYLVVEYTKDGMTLKENGSVSSNAGRFTLIKNADGTYTVDSFAEIPDNASKADFADIFGTDLADEAFAVYSNGGGSELWNTIVSEDAAYYSYDNNLGLDKIVESDESVLDLAHVSFSVEGAHTMYAQEDSNVRSAGTTSATAFDGIEKGQEIKVTGTANGWGRVTMNDRTGYISASLLGDTKPAKEEKKEEKKAENKEEQKEEVSTGYICGKIEDCSGNTVTVNGITASITPSTGYSGGDLAVGKQAKLDYKEVNGEIIATNLYVWEEEPADGVYIASDGRVVDLRDPSETTEDQSQEERLGGIESEPVMSSDGRAIDTGDHYGMLPDEGTEHGLEDAGIQNDSQNDSHEEVEVHEDNAAPAEAEVFDEIG